VIAAVRFTRYIMESDADFRK